MPNLTIKCKSFLTHQTEKSENSRGEKFKATRVRVTTFLRLTVPSFARAPPPHTPRMAAPSGITSRIRRKKGCRQEKGKRFLFQSPYALTNFPGSPILLLSHLPELSRGCMAGWRSDLLLTFHHIKCINHKYTTQGFSQSEHTYLASNPIKKRSGNGLLTTPHVLPPSRYGGYF